jgi:hypothetical protein
MSCIINKVKRIYTYTNIGKRYYSIGPLISYRRIWIVMVELLTGFGYYHVCPLAVDAGSDGWELP